MTVIADTPDAPTRRRRGWVWLAAIVLVLLVGLALFWFQPHKLFIDERVSETIPTVTAPSSDTPSAPEGSSDEPPPPAADVEPQELAAGSFVSLDHGTSGEARVLRLADDTRILRLEELDTDNGPDLFVYLSSNPASGPEGEFDEDFVSLGRLKGNQGDQNYEVPAALDLSRLRSVVIWCDRFDSAFGAADLNSST
ncbi:MAG: DM13 domain-containing protein [Actinomycetota bacterium]